MVIVIVEDLEVAEGPLNMRNRSSTFRHGGFAYLADSSAMVREGGGEGEIAQYTGGGDRIRGVGGGNSKHAGEYVDEDRDKGEDEDLGKDLDKDLICLYF